MAVIEILTIGLVVGGSVFWLAWLVGNAHTFDRQPGRRPEIGFFPKRWANFLEDKTVIDLRADGRLHLIEPTVRRAIPPDRLQRGLIDPAFAWMNENVPQDAWGHVPADSITYSADLMWFANPEDAFAFKMRWY